MQPQKNLNIQNFNSKNYSGLDILKNIEKNLYFFNLSIVRMLSIRMGFRKVILDFGAGVGTIAKIWFTENSVKPECLEIDSRFRKILIKRGLVCYQDIKSLKKKYELIYSSNVLEHIKNDQETLKKLHSKLENDGLLCLFVPAFNCLYSDLDWHVGHYRRYTKKDITLKLELAKFDIIDCYYSDSIGFLVWLLFIKIFKFKLTNNHSSSACLKFYDKFLLPISFFLDSLGLKFMLGKNLVVIAKKNKQG